MQTVENSKQPDCPICGEGHTSCRQGASDGTYRDITRAVTLHFKTCDVCNSDFAGHEESLKNVQEVAAFKQEIDQLLQSTP
jgi:HTH-type transcriptional regulator / antitoxin MqsA